MKKLKKIIISLLVALITTPMNVSAEEYKPYDESNSAYDGVVCDESGQCYTPDLHIPLYGHWQWNYYAPNGQPYIYNDKSSFAVLPNVPDTGASTEKLNFNLLNSNLSTVATGGIIPGNSATIPTQSNYMYVQVESTQNKFSSGDTVQYFFTFEITSGVNIFDYIKHVIVCDVNPSNYYVTNGNLLVVEGTCEIKSNFYIMITLTQNVNGGFQVGSGTSLYLNDAKDMQNQQNWSDIKGQLNSIVQYLSNIDGQISGNIISIINEIRESNNVLVQIGYDIQDICSDINNEITQIYDLVYSGFGSVIRHLSNWQNSLSDELLKYAQMIESNFIVVQDQINNYGNQIINAIRGDDSEITSKDDIDKSNTELKQNITEYDSIENGLKDDFKNNMNQIKPNLNILDNSDFRLTNNFISTNIVKIVELSPVTKMSIMYSLFMGFVFTLIGISVRK